MLEGLEISEIHISQVHLAHNDFRFDPEFYSKANLITEDAVKKRPHKLLGDICDLIAGPFGSAITAEHYDAASKFRYIRATDIQSFFINEQSPAYVGESVFKAFPQFHLKKNDILLTVVGMNFGKSALIDESDCPAIFSCKSTLIRNPSVNPWYLLTYLSCGIGHNLIRRGQRGAAQPGINLSDIETVLVPVVGDFFQNGVEDLVKSSRSLVVKSHATYNDAETLLLKTLGMHDFSHSEESVNIKSFRNSFGSTGRLDAEFYQPKYEQMVDQIVACPHARLASLVNIQKSIEPGSDAYTDDEDGLPFLRVADYSKFGLSIPQKRLSAAFVAANKKELEELRPKKNTILFSKDGSVGEALCLHDDADFITSGAILHLEVRDEQSVLPDYLTLALNSTLVRTQAERDAGGSIILHWRVGEIEDVVVPLVDMDTQKKIAALIQQSFALKAESERLLEAAKRAVEIAIEQDEAAGLAYLEAQTKSVVSPAPTSLQ